MLVHRKFAFHERPAATAACLVRIENGTVVQAHIAVGSVGPRPLRVSQAEERLVGTSPADTDALAEAAVEAAHASGAVEDANGSAEYKAELVRVLVERCLRDIAGGL